MVLTHSFEKAMKNFSVFCHRGVPAIAALFLVIPAHSQTEPVLPRAPQAQVTTLTEPGYFSEPSVAVNPINPKQGCGLPGARAYRLLD